MTETPLLIKADTARSADLFHALPLEILDPFLYAEVDGRRVAVNSVLESDRITGLGTGVEVLDVFSLGFDKLLNSGVSYPEAELETDLRACRELGIEHAVVGPDFPLALAEKLRGGGIGLTVDRDRFVFRRRVKSPEEIAGIRRAQAAANAAMALAAQLLGELPDGVSCESIRVAMQELCARAGCRLPDTVIVARNEQSALGHDIGSGPIVQGDMVLIDIWPQDRGSRCWADMTRTFMAGGAEAPGELREYWELTRASLAAVLPALAPGAVCRDIFGLACESFEAAGQPTVRTKDPGTTLVDGFFHGLGHGVGLEVHEPPYLGRSDETLAAGDVVAVEPGCYRRGFGGVRLEELVLITEHGAEVLTDFPHSLET